MSPLELDLGSASFHAASAFPKNSGTSQTNMVVGTLPPQYELPCGSLEKPRWRTWKDADPATILQELRSFLRYDDATGNFIVTYRRWNTAKPVGTVYGSMTQNGYKEARILGKSFFMHNLVWLWHNEDWPAGEIDHINGDRIDNRIENLRDTSRGVNLRNAKMKSTNTSGYTGVHFNKALNKWQGRVMVNYRVVYRCYGETAEVAAALRESWIAAHPELGFTERHGK